MTAFRLSRAVAVAAAAGLLFNAFQATNEIELHAGLAGQQASETAVAPSPVTPTPALPLFAPAAGRAAETRFASADGDVAKAANDKRPPDLESVNWQRVTFTPAPAERRTTAAAAHLAGDIQRQLRRLGCYEGPLNGEWDAATRTAMGRALTLRNARLSVKDADVALLALAQGSGDGLCRGGTQAIAKLPTPVAPGNPPAPSRSPLPGMMSIGGPHVELAAPHSTNGVATSVAAGAQLAGKPAASASAQRKTARRSTVERDAERFFTHPLNRISTN